MIDIILNIDNVVNIFFSNLLNQYNFLYPIFNLITFFGSETFIIFFSIALSLYFLIKERFDILGIFSKKYLIPFWFSIFFAEGITFFLKNLVDRVGPAGRMLLENDPSFPSAHATIAVAFYGVLYLLFKRGRPVYLFLTLLIIFMIGLSRLILNVHFLSDILAGYLIGAFGLFVAMYVSKKIK